MGKTWGRTTTHPDCYHHGTAAQKFYDDNLRRFRQTGDWAEFHVDRDAWEAEHNNGPKQVKVDRGVQDAEMIEKYGYNPFRGEGGE